MLYQNLLAESKQLLLNLYRYRCRLPAHQHCQYGDDVGYFNALGGKNVQWRISQPIFVV